MKKILVPTDFSENAENAFDYAVTMAGTEEVEFILLNAYHAPNAGTGGMLVSITDVLRDESAKDLKAAVADLQEKYTGLQIKGISLYGELLEVVDRVITSENCDVVVMGTQGASGLKKVLVGSNTEKVIREVKIPVIAVPENGEYSGFDHIVFATDMKVINDARIMNPLLDVAKKFKARVSVLYVVKEGTEPKIDEDIERLRLEDYFEDIEHSYHVVFSNDVEKGISQFLADEGADLLAMIPRHVGFFDRLFKGSITQKFAYHTKTPLLAIHDTKE
ncbi:MAG: hypothetical protein CL843_05115 [Crocinitomicaceae bacterium]|nr:hypothetical protein [Crocinitomicaceae bacterium]|tara:strand:- start:4075 stop:4902 length:828 start_codon:yes stop_codon:yes gene_type:complete